MVLHFQGVLLLALIMTEAVAVVDGAAAVCDAVVLIVAGRHFLDGGLGGGLGAAVGPLHQLHLLLLGLLPRRQLLQLPLDGAVGEADEANGKDELHHEGEDRVDESARLEGVEPVLLAVGNGVHVGEGGQRRHVDHLDIRGVRLRRYGS